MQFPKAHSPIPLVPLIVDFLTRPLQDVNAHKASAHGKVRWDFCRPVMLVVTLVECNVIGNLRSRQVGLSCKSLICECLLKRPLRIFSSFLSGGNKRDKLKGTNAQDSQFFADFRRFLLIFAFPGNCSISGAQIFAENRRKPQISAENRRKPQIFAETRLSHLVCPF